MTRNIGNPEDSIQASQSRCGPVAGLVPLSHWAPIRSSIHTENTSGCVLLTAISNVEPCFLLDTPLLNIDNPEKRKRGRIRLLPLLKSSITNTELALLKKAYEIVNCMAETGWSSCSQIESGGTYTPRSGYCGHCYNHCKACSFDLDLPCCIAPESHELGLRAINLV